MKKKILILAGGYSKEREISLLTAKSVFRELKKTKKYRLKIADPSFGFVSLLKKYKPNVVFNALHGQFGEDGYVQSILESIKVKYTHSGVMSSFMAMDKEISKKIFIKNKILTPKYIKYIFKDTIDRNILNLIKKKLGLPVVIKPLNEGSSVNVYICNKKNIFQNLKKLKNYKEILIEKFIPGREIQVAILGKKKIGAIELKPKRQFYDYEAKYNPKAKTKHIIPVDLTLKEYKKINEIALKAHNLLKCKGVTRSDFRFYKGKFYLLEVNTQPGMTSLSLVPEIARYRKISFLKLIEWMIKDASINR
tara:strand:+ start:628 stop:1548 length:921 start_codon:yes stop_codon:yes gene_type:complete